MKCKVCGAHNDKEACFCYECGSPLSKEKKKTGLIIGLILAVLIIGIAAFAISRLIGGNEEVKKVDSDTAVSDEEEVDEVEDETEDEEEVPEEEVPVYDSTEGGIHRYEYVVEDCTWTQAYERAKQAGGYLVRINSREEYNYILSDINALGLQKIQFLMGGRRDASGMDYYWVDENNQLYGDVLNSSMYWADSEWMINEPSYMDGEIEESYLDFYYNETEGRWVWNDVPNDIIAVVSYFSGKIGYIIEYEY